MRHPSSSRAPSSPPMSPLRTSLLVLLSPCIPFPSSWLSFFCHTALQTLSSSSNYNYVDCVTQNSFSYTWKLILVWYSPIDKLSASYHKCSFTLGVARMKTICMFQKHYFLLRVCKNVSFLFDVLLVLLWSRGSFDVANVVYIIPLGDSTSNAGLVLHVYLYTYSII